MVALQDGKAVCVALGETTGLRAGTPLLPSVALNCSAMVYQGPGLVAGPGPEGGDELVLVDETDLEGDQAEEERDERRPAGARARTRGPSAASRSVRRTPRSGTRSRRRPPRCWRGFWKTLASIRVS